jgi:glycosyltransferase involved in cell wall biosynthesis
MTTKNKITAFVLTYNGEHYIEDCLKSLMWADEVMIVDSGSKDKTVEIAQSLGVRVETNPWAGYGNQLNYALSKATYDWVFFTDQDEVVMPELADNIRKELNGDMKYLAYNTGGQNSLFGHWLQWGGTIEANIRFVNRHKITYCDEQHTRICEQVPRKTINGVVRHDMAPTLLDWWDRSFKLATIEAEVNYAKGERFSAFKTAMFWWRFVRRYVFKLGFLDGWAGLYMALQRSIYILVYQACLLELDRGIRQPKEDPARTKFR